MTEKHIFQVNCFVAMPFANENIWTTIQELIEEINEEARDFKINLRRSDGATREPFVYQNIARHIDECDIAIVDLTGQNSNVIFEFGYAFAKGKGIIPFTQENSDDIPIDYRSFVYIHYKTNDLITFKARLRLRLQEVIESISNKRKLLAQEGVFDVPCFTDRKSADLKERLESAKDQIRIIQTNLKTVLEDYADSIEKAISKNPSIKVELLTLDPESYFAAVRASQLGSDVSEFRAELHEALFALHERFKKADNFDIRIYDDFPTQICFIIDKDIYNCVVSKYQQSRNNCVFKLDANYPILHISFNLHFVSVWRDAATTKKYTPRIQRKNIKKIVSENKKE